MKTQTKFVVEPLTSIRFHHIKARAKACALFLIGMTGVPQATGLRVPIFLVG